MTKKALTPEQVRERMRARGMTVSRWAREHGYPLQAVYRVMGGQSKGYFGQAYDIAVALGLKLAPADESTDATADRNTQARAAA